MNVPPVLRLESVTISRGGHRLIHDLNLTLEPGEILAVTGRSGSGRTALLSTVAGMSAPETGFVRRRPGYVPVLSRDPRLLPGRTALKNIEFVLPDADRGRAREWLGRVGLPAGGDTYPLAMSEEMMQRVSIARALACRAPLLLVDAPFAHLDPDAAALLRQVLLDQLHVTDATALWVTDDLDEAEDVADRTLVLDGSPGAAWQILSPAFARSGAGGAR